MAYYILDTEYKEKERIKFREKFPLALQTAYFGNNFDPRDIPEINFTINTGVDRDYMSESGFIVTNEKIREILDKLITKNTDYKYYECEIGW
jgi:hypothetical protein